jgi:hypothetical protein
MFRNRFKKILFVILAIVGILLTIQLKGALAETYQLTGDDFGVWGDESWQCPNPDETYPYGWCWNSNFFPAAKLFRAPDGSLNMQGNGSEIASVNFEIDWAGNAVSPHRDFQANCFHKGAYYDPNVPVPGGMVSTIPQCQWSDDSGLWMLSCIETRPEGFEGGPLYCNAYETPDPNDCNGITDGMGGVSDCNDEVCLESCIEKVPALPGCPGDNDCDGIPNDQDPCPDIPGECPVPGLVLEQNDFSNETRIDLRHNDPSYLPYFNQISTVGGWEIGISIQNQEKAQQVREIRLVGSKQTIIINEPDVYTYLGQVFHDYTAWLGHTVNSNDVFNVEGTDINGQPIIFKGSDGNPTTITCSPAMNVEKGPVIEVLNTKIQEDGDIVVKFSAPSDPRTPQIRVRLMGVDETGYYTFYTDDKYFPPFQIVQKDGDIIPDKMKVIIPASHPGTILRLEYRVYGDFGLVRNCTILTLPTE